MTKYMIGVSAIILFAGVLTLAPMKVEAALTEAQVQSILSLLQSFGAEQSIVNNVGGSLRGELATPKLTPPEMFKPTPAKPTPIPFPIFDEDTSDDEIIQLNNLRIQSIQLSDSITSLPAFITASHDFGVRCLKYESQASASGVTFPCPVPPSLSYQIRVDKDTRLLLRNRQRAGITDFEVEDRINVYGFMDRDTRSVDALIVRNLDKPSQERFSQLNNVEVATLPSSQKPPASFSVVRSFFDPCLGFGVGETRGAPIPCPLGTEVEPTSRSPGIAGVFLQAQKYLVEVTARTQLLQRDRTSMALSDIAVGDKLNIYGIERTRGVIEALVIRNLSKPKPTTGSLSVVVTDGSVACAQPSSVKISLPPSGGPSVGNGIPPFPYPCGILYNATVAVFDGGGNIQDKKTTDSGAAVFENLRAGKYSVQASASGYQDGSAVTTVEPGAFQTITIPLQPVGGGEIKIEARSSLNGTVGQYFSAVFVTSGGIASYRWQVSAGTLPPGLKLLDIPPGGVPPSPCYIDLEGKTICPPPRVHNTIFLQGTPTQAGTYKFEITVQDSQGNRGSAVFVSIISPSGGSNLPPVIHGISGPTVLRVGETGTWTMTASDPENGLLSYNVIWGDETKAEVQSGVPAPTRPGVQTATFTHSYARTGVYTPTFTVTDNVGFSARTSISVNVSGTDNVFTITTPSLPSAAVGKSYSAQISATGGSSDYYWTAGILPPGLSLFASVCVTSPCKAPAEISGTPTKAGTYTFDINVVSGTEKATKTFTLIVNPSSTQPSITVLSPNGGEVWQKGVTQIIRWKAPSTVSYVNIDLYPYAPPGSLAPTILYHLGTTLNGDGTFGWVAGRDINGNFVPEGKYIVRVSDINSNSFDNSNAPFSIAI